MIFYLFALLFTAGLFLVTFSLFLPGRARPIITQRIGKPSRLKRILTSQHQFLVECGLGDRLPVVVYFILRIAAGIGAFLLVAGILGPGVGALAAAGGFLAVRWVLAPMRARRQRALSEGVIDFGHAFVALLKAGSQPHEAVTVLAGPSGPAAMREHLVIVAHEIRTEGMARAMVKAIERVGDPLFDTLATAILVQSEKGAELSEALQVTIKNIEQGAILIRRASSLKMQATMAALIVPIMICSLVFGFQIHDGHSGAYFSFYYTFVGQVVEFAVLCLFLVGYFVMKRIQKIAPQPRIRLRET